MNPLELRTRPAAVPPSQHTIIERWSRLPKAWLWAGLWIMPLIVGLSVGTAHVLTSRQTPIFRSSATLAIVPAASIEEMPDVMRTLETLERRTVIATFAQMVSTARAREDAARALSLPASALHDYRSRALVIPNTNVVRVEVEGPDARRVAELANALAAATSTHAQAMYRIFETTTLASAVQPPGPVAPNPKRALSLALILGAFLGVAATYLFVRLRGLDGGSS